MPLDIQRAGVAFRRGPTAEDGTEAPVSDTSTTLDLSAWKLRGVVTPDGHQLGAITAVDETGMVVDFGLADDVDGAHLLRVGEDWPLQRVAFHVATPRDEPFELALLIEPR